MAVLNKIRQRSVFLIIIIALALFSFVLADVIRNGGMSSQKSQNTIATVNGEDIEREQFARQVEAYQRNLGPDASTSQAVNMVWENNLRQVILEDEFEELGLRVEGAQIKALLRQEMSNNPNFTNEAGVFDEGRLKEYVATLKSSSPAAYQQWLDYETSIGKSARENVYFNMVRAGIGATLTEGEQVYRRTGDKVDIKFVQISYNSVPDSEVEVSKEEIREYMEENPKRFQTDASRDIQYVHFTEEASEEDEAEVKEAVTVLLESRVEYNPVTGENDTLPGFRDIENVERFVNDNSDENFQDTYLFREDLPSDHADELFNLEEGEVYGPYKDAGAWNISKMLDVAQIPDSANARHILVSYRGTPIGQELSRTKAEAQELADSIIGVVRNNGSQFSDLAAQYSSDTSNKDSAGELGWFTSGDMVPAFNDYVFTNDEGDIGVVETEFGYHVIHIQEQTDKQRAVKLATISRSVEPSEESLNDLYTEVTRFEIAARNGNFSEVAAENNKEVRPVQGMQVMDERIPGIGSQRRIVQWAFEEDSEVGDVERFETRDGYVIVRLTSENKGGLRSVESASSTVLPILQKQKKAEIIKNRIEGNTLSEIAQNQGAEVNNASSMSLDSPTLPGAGNEPIVVGAAFALEQGEVSSPISGNNGVYVIEVLQKTRAADMDSYRSYADREASRRRANINEQVFSALKNTAEIEDKRARFY